MPTLTVTQFTGTSFSEGTFQQHLAGATPVGATATEVLFQDAVNPAIESKFIGTGFTFDAFGTPTGGTVTSIEFVNTSSTVATMSGFSFSLPDLVNAILQVQIGNDAPLDALFAPFDIVFDATAVTAQETIFNDAFFTLGDTAIAGAGGSYMELGEFTDSYVAGSGFDQISFANETGGSGAVVNLSTGFIRDTYNNVETITGQFESLRGSSFADDLTGDGVRNHIRGLAGADTLDGGAGTDLLRYDRDVSYGGTFGVTVDLENNTAVDGFGDTDTIFNFEDVRGTDFNDSITGDDGNNVLEGFDGSDTMDGGGGNDTINPGDNNSGYDRVDLNSGDDTYVFSDMNTSDAYLEIAGEDADIGLTFTINGIANTGSITKGAFGTDTLIDISNPLDAGSNLGGVGLRGGTANDVYNINNKLNGQQWIQILSTEGNDTINITSGTVRLTYNQEMTAINANLATGVIQVGVGHTDTVNGDAWEVRGTAFADTMTGSAADESFISFGGDDTIDGGAGFDRLRYDRSGVDAVVVDLSTGSASGTWNGTAFSQTISNIEHVRGSREGDDALVGTGANERFEGRGGDDFIVGGGGNDTIQGGEGNDTAIYEDATGGVGVYLQVTGGQNVGGGQGTDILESIENLIGSDHNDRLGGDSLDNMFAGGEGDDIIRGKGGNDTFFGGGGNDNLRGDTGVDFLVGELGNDALFGVGGQDFLDGGIGNDSLYGGRDNDTVYGGDDNDVLRGNRNNDELYGEAGSDSLYGGGNNDMLSGGDDRDFLLGENGNDTLDGGAGDDNLTGGAGVDQFVMNTGYGYDRVIDFEDGTDLINVSGFGITDLSGINASQVASGVRIAFGGGDTMLLQGELISIIDSSDFIFA